VKTAAIIALLFSLSCDDQPSAAPVPVGQVASLWRKALCEKIYACCTPAERMADAMIGTSVEDCEAKLQAETSLFLGDLPTSVAAGRVAYHPEQMATCLADLKARSCDLVRMPPGNRSVTEMCAGVFEPKVPLGGACLEYWDCVGGWCAGDFGGLQDRCVPKHDIGGDCDEGPECFSGICGDDRVCVAPPPGIGNLCAIGDNDGQH
jgi:hypothetical protein